jgi:hypothetical protein
MIRINDRIDNHQLINIFKELYLYLCQSFLVRKLYTVFLILIAAISAILSCSKSGSSGSGDNVTYEVITSGGTWSGDYFDDSNGSMQLKLVNNLPSGWKYSFSVPKGNHVGLVLSALPDNSGSGENVTANIYVNGVVVATDSGKFGVNAQYTLN